MNNIQINGQRRWGPPENWTGPPPPHGTEVFIKNLPEEVFELELYNMFSTIGTVYEVRLPINWNGFNRGYAFLRFTNIHSADRAIDTFNGFAIRKGRTIKVARSVDNTRLFLSAVPIDKNSEQLKNDLLQYVENIKRVYVYPTLENRSVFRGYAFVEFETHRDAAIAKRILSPDICQVVFEKKCIAAWANPLPFLDQSTLKSLHVLFLRNIPKEIKSVQLKKLVENVIKGEEVKHIKRLNDFAFLSFKDHQSAEKALSILQDVPFLIPEFETQVEWAIPREMANLSFPALEKENDVESNQQKRFLMSRLSPQDSNDFFSSGNSTHKLNHSECSSYSENVYPFQRKPSTLINNSALVKNDSSMSHSTGKFLSLSNSLDDETNSYHAMGSYHYLESESLGDKQIPSDSFGNSLKRFLTHPKSEGAYNCSDFLNSFSLKTSKNLSRNLVSSEGDIKTSSLSHSFCHGMRNSESNRYNPFQQKYNLDNECRSLGSEESSPIDLSGFASYSSLSPPTSANESYGSPSQIMWFDEQNFSSLSHVENNISKRSEQDLIFHDSSPFGNVWGRDFTK